MLPSLQLALTVVAAIGCGVVAGVFFAFSVFVMRALGRLPAAQGIAAMQVINVTALTPLFMLLLFGTGLACVVLAIALMPDLHEPAAGYGLAGAVLYLAGVILVTILFNVPRNNRLAAVDPASEDAGLLWTGYLAGWTVWNHVRTATSLAAAILLTAALRL